MIRTVSVTETVVNLSGVPLPNVGTLATLITPGGTSPLDSAGDTIDLTPIPNLTNASGVYLYDGTGTTGLIAPGDIYQNVGGSLVALPGCYWQITYLQTVRTSTSYAYTASVINAGTWTAAVSNLGLLKVYMTDVFGNAQPITPSRGYTIALNADNVWSGGIGAGRNIPGGAGFWLSTDGTGTITAYLIRQSEFSVALSDWILTDTTNGTIKYFTVPSIYTNDAGVYNSGTTYAAGAVARRASDDEPFISMTSGNVGNPLTDGAHWANYAGEKITLLTVAVSPPGQQASTTGNITHDTNVPALPGDPSQSPASLHDDLGNIVYRDTQRLRYLGAYAGGTAYVVNDLASQAGSYYINILASTGHAPPNTTYWAAIGGGGGGASATFVWVTKAANYAITGADSGILLDATSGDIPFLNASLILDRLTLGSGLAISGSVLNTTAAGVQAPNTFDAGPTTGSPSLPTFRTIVPADLPIASISALGAVKADGTSITITAGGIITAAASGSTLASLGDANISSPADGDLLRYQTSDSKWHNHSPTGPGSIRWEPVSDSTGALLFDSTGAILVAPATN